jgi:hypothetical protein
MMLTPAPRLTSQSPRTGGKARQHGPYHVLVHALAGRAARVSENAASHASVCRCSIVVETSPSPRYDSATGSSSRLMRCTSWSSARAGNDEMITSPGRAAARLSEVAATVGPVHAYARRDRACSGLAIQQTRCLVEIADIQACATLARCDSLGSRGCSGRVAAMPRHQS